MENEARHPPIAPRTFEEEVLKDGMRRKDMALFTKGDSKIGRMLGAKLIEEELLESGIEEGDLD